MGLAQGLVLVGGIVRTFWLPQAMTIADYALWKTFVLYASFAGVAHLGYLDGLYVRWARDGLPEDNASPLVEGLQGLLLTLGPSVAVITLIVTLVVKQWPWFIGLGLATYVILYNVVALLYFESQARLMFGVYSILQMLTAASFLLLLVVLSLAGRLTVAGVLMILLISQFLPIPFRLSQLRIRFGKSALPLSALVGVWRQDLKAGVLLLGGNLGWLLLYNLGSLVANLQFSATDFAIYAFATSVVSVLYLGIQSATLVVFPVMARKEKSLSVRDFAVGESVLMVAWGLGLGLLFPINGVVRQWLPAYSSSLPIVQILFMPFGLIAVLSVLHSNYFAARTNHMLLLSSACGVVGMLLIQIGGLWVAASIPVVAIGWSAGFLLIYLLNVVWFLPRTGLRVKMPLRPVLFSAACMAVFLIVRRLSDVLAIQMSLCVASVVVLALGFYRKVILPVHGVWAK